MFPDQEGSKPLVNCFIGQLNQQYVTKSKGCVTGDYNIAMGVLLNESEKKQSPKVYQVKDLYFIRSEYKEKKVSGNVPIYRHIIASSYIKIDKLYHHVCKKDTLVIAYNTDSIKVINPKQFTLKDEPYAGDIRREYEINIKGTFFDDLEMNNVFKYTPTKWNEIQENKENYNEIVDFVGKNSCMVVGMAGSGKTEIIKKIWTDESIALTFTNKAADNLKQRGVMNTYTFDSFFLEQQSTSFYVKKLAKYKTVCIDE